MKTKNIIILSILFLIVLISFILMWQYREKVKDYDHSPILNLSSTSDENITFYYDKDFGLAITEDQVVVNSYIPPCDTGFNYCLYYIANHYQGTNFDSAGISIKKLSDVSVDDCLTSLPDGRTNITPVVKNNDNYSVSRISPLSDAAAGHYSNGDIYRLSYQNLCYEFQTRIGESQFANYPDGSIKLFSSKDRELLNSKLIGIVGGININSIGRNIQLP